MHRTKLMLGAAMALVLGVGSVYAQDGEAGQPATPPAEASRPATASAAGDSEIQVTEMVLTKALENGAPTEPATTFSRADGRIYCVVRVANPSRQATTVRVAFERATDAEPIARARGVELDIPARPRYRTVARTGTNGAPGQYRCVVRDAEGRVLQHAAFELTE